MRLMLGTKDNPSLLVDIEQEYSPTHFEFWVVNGCWKGTYTDGHVTVWHPDEPWTELDKTEILCYNQNRLRGEYKDVFWHFHDTDYVAPKPEKFVMPASWDDDIPF
jgi:hypothetical protein